MLPFGTLKLTSRRTSCSSKANDTLSNTTADDASSGGGFAKSGDVMYSTGLVPTTQLPLFRFVPCAHRLAVTA